MTVVETVAWLVDIPSETGTEGRICTQIATRLLPRFGENVVRVNNSLVVGQRTGRPLVLLVGHIDTVPAQQQGPATIVDGRLYGLGSTDMKAGVGVMIHLQEELDSTEFDVVGIYYEGEEGPASGNGLEPVLQRVPWLQEAEFAVVLEPCDGEIQIGCNGVINATVTFLGKASHSARPWLGENAITKAGAWLHAMDRLPPESHTVGGLEYKEVMSITKAAGGVASNVIPSSFTLNLNFRFTPDMSEEEARSRLAVACAAADQVEVVDYAPAGSVDSDHPLVGRLAEASGSALTPKQGWTDVARLGVYGIPAVNFGPGDTGLAHQVEESVALADIDLVHTTLMKVLGGV